MDQDDEEVEINVHDDDSPLDMRITKHDSDSDSVRPSVIRRAPSFKETSNSPSRGKSSLELVSRPPRATAALLLDPTSTCDPFIDEHFRRSLGTDYDLIIRNKQEQEQLALQKQRMIDEQILLMQQQQQQVSQQVTQQQQQQQNILKHHKKHQIHQHHQAMLAAKHSQAIATPPTTPSPPILAQLPPVSAQASTVPVPQSQKQVIITEHSDADEMSVDDHFAKALGDTWKQFQNDGK
jgi:Transcription cofactor vestigial-like protein 4